MHTTPTLTLTPQAAAGRPAATFAYDQVLQAELDGLTVDAEAPMSANDAIDVLAGDWALATGPDTAAALWARLTALDPQAATADRDDATVSYRPADVARWLLSRYHDAVTDPELSRRLGWVAATDPDPADGPHSHAAIEQAWEAHEQIDADGRVGTALDEVARTWQIPLPGDDYLLGLVNLWPRPDYGYDVQLLGDDMVGEIVPTAGGWTVVDVDVPTQPTREQAVEALLEAANLLPAAGPAAAAGPRRLTVEVPACWVGLLAFGEFEDDGTVAGPLTDLLGRPVTSEKQVDGPADPTAHYDDVRTVGGRGDGLDVQLGLASGQSNYWTAVVVDADSDRGGMPVVESEPDFDLHGPIELHTWDGNGPVIIDLQLTWPTENRRQTAIDTLKRAYGVSKRVAARTVDEARWELCSNDPAEVADIVGSIAVGHLSAAAVGRLLEAASDGRLAGMWDGPRLLAVVADGQQVAHVDGADWTVMQVGDTTVDTGLPADGGPNPWTAARRLAGACR